MNPDACIRVRCPCVQIDTGGAPHEVKEHSLSNLKAQTAQTLALLGPSLSLYQIHSATLESGVLRAADVLQELESIKMMHGVCVGLSVTGKGGLGCKGRVCVNETRDVDVEIESFFLYSYHKCHGGLGKMLPGVARNDSAVIFWL